MSSSGKIKAAYKYLKNYYFSPKIEIKKFRENMDNFFECKVLPNKVENNEFDCGGISCDLLTPELYDSHKAVLYVHGGSFVAGSRKSCRAFAAVLANAFNSKVYIPEFRLAPTYPFPSSIDDIHAVFKYIYNEELISLSLEQDFDSTKDNIPKIIVVASDSGASIALGLLQKLNERMLKSVQNVILFSPYLDISPSSTICSAKKMNDKLLTSETYRRSGEFYTFQDNSKSPLVSPLNIDSSVLKKFPPVYIQMGEEELLLTDAELFEKKMADSGVKCILDVWPKMMGMFQLADDILDESHLAIEKIAKYLNGRKITSKDSQKEIQIKLETVQDRNQEIKR